MQWNNARSACQMTAAGRESAAWDGRQPINCQPFFRQPVFRQPIHVIRQFGTWVPDQTHKRIDLAREQLDVALELFLSKRSMVSALTLAGAAEEILGKALEHRGRRTTLEYEHSVIEPVESFLRRQPFLWKDFIQEKNRVRNAAKHMRGQSDIEVVVDLEDEALWMLVRACDNYRRLDFETTPRMEQFDGWFYENVAGIKIDV